MRQSPPAPQLSCWETRWSRLHKSPHLLAKALRFAIIGSLNSFIFASVTALLVSMLWVAPVPASIVGYCVSVPISFLGHRQFSFRSRGHWPVEASRFVLVQLVSIAATAGSMYLAVDHFAAAYYWGMVAAVILVPVLNFALANLWVFGKPAARDAAP